MRDDQKRVTGAGADVTIEMHRRACEARHYARMPGAERVACLERIAKARGDKAAQQLADDIRALRRAQA